MNKKESQLFLLDILSYRFTQVCRFAETFGNNAPQNSALKTKIILPYRRDKPIMPCQLVKLYNVCKGNQLKTCILDVQYSFILHDLIIHWISTRVIYVHNLFSNAAHLANVSSFFFYFFFF